MAMELLGAAARVLDPAQPDERTARQLVYRLNGPQKGYEGWERRIVELANGRSVAEVVSVLYREELGRGAWITDVGVWSGLFVRSVLRVLCELSARGDIRLTDRTSRTPEPETADSPDAILSRARRTER